MAEPARNFEQPHERTARLHVLGLDEATIQTAVLRGFAERQNCTAFDPPSYPGTVQWAQTHRALRELLASRDWTPDDSHNYSRVVSPDQTIAVTVATGDDHTGKVEQQYGTVEPRTKYPKGSETKLAVEANVQMTLWTTTAAADAVAPRSQQATWMLLISTGEHEVRYELSRPKGQDEEGRVVSWSERIVFPPIEIDTLTSRYDEDDDGLGGLDVPVERI